jgi:hypothetical protein
MGFEHDAHRHDATLLTQPAPSGSLLETSGPPLLV